MLYPNERAVLDAALKQVRVLTGDPNHTVAAAAMDTAGRVHTAVNVYHFTGGPCAELVVLGVAAAAGAGPLTTMVAVAEDSRQVVPPCGRCRQTIADLHPDCRVIVPTTGGPEDVPVRTLLPYGYVHPDCDPPRVVRFSARYLDDVLSGAKTTTIRHDDPVHVGPAWFVFEDDEHTGYQRVRGVVDEVTDTRLDLLGPEEVRQENASSVEALRAGLRGHYPGLADDAPVSVVRFHLPEADDAGR